MPDFRRFWKIVNPKWIVWFNDRFAVNKNKFIIQKRFVWYLAFTVVKKTQGKHTIYANKCDRKYFVKKNNFFFCLLYTFFYLLFKHMKHALSHRKDHLHWSTRLRLTWNLHRTRCLGASKSTCVHGISLHLYSLYFATCIVYTFILPNKQEHNRTNNTFGWLTERVK